MSTRSERFEMRLEPQLLEKVDFWRGSQPDFPSRAEAVRRLMERALAAEGEPAQFQPNKGERLMLWMLAEVWRATVKNGDASSAQLVLDALYGGHFWALDWELPDILTDSARSQLIAREVAEILEMWRQIEFGLSELDPESRRRVVEQCGSEAVSFIGFDGNNECDHMSVARFMVDKLGRFTEFRGRDFNAHWPRLDKYRRMLARFTATRLRLRGRSLNEEELVSLLKADE